MAGKKKTVKREDMTTIWIEKDVVAMLEDLGRMHDTYSTVIRRLIDGNGSGPGERGKPREHE